MAGRTWIKIFADNWLRGTLREETAEIRGIWVDVLALAGDSAYGDDGLIKLAESVGYTDEQIAAILKLGDMAEWKKAKQRLIKTERIEVLENNIIMICNWKKYQSEYERQKPYRVTNESDKGKLLKKVIKNPSPSLSPSILVSKKEEMFNEIWEKYPDKVGRKAALNHFIASVNNEKDYELINKALDNYLKSDRVAKRYIQNGSTWFNNWRDWIDYKKPEKPSVPQIL